MAKFYKGTEVKFSIEIVAQGFSMDDDDFEIEVASTKGGSLKGYKNPPMGATTDIVLFKEVPVSDSSDSGEESTAGWYGIVDTSKLATGSLRVIATAHVPDVNAPDGIRNEVAKAELGELTNP